MGLETQLQWIRYLQNALRSSGMDLFFKGWDHADSAYFSITIIALVWHLWDRRLGARLFYVLVLSLICNKILKVLFQQPRPCHIDPLVGILCSNSEGFPSGAAQTAMVLSGFVFMECQKWLYRSLGLVFAGLLCFSRVYLGVHYPTDILGGLAVGVILLLVYKKGFPLCEKRWKRAIVAFPFFPLLIGNSVSSSWAFFLFFALVGMAAGLLSFDRQKTPQIQSRAMKGWQAFSTVVGLWTLFVAISHFPRLMPLVGLAEGYWLSFLGGWIAQKMARLRRNSILD
ncbi:MAG: phosphatase PAP2 family protein [Chlamydiota bacterium]